MKQLFITLLGLSLATLLAAQNIDEMNPSKKKETLLRIAKETVMEHGPDFYREYKQPNIEHKYISENSTLSRDLVEQHNDRSYYEVKFLYDETEESFDWDFSARVRIWGDTGQAFEIIFGTGLGRDLDEPRAEPYKKATWKKQPPRKRERKREPYIIRDVTASGDTIITVIP